MGTRELRLFFTSLKYKKEKSQIGIPELTKAVRNVTALDGLAVSAELESFSEKKGRKGPLHIILGKYTYSN